MVSDGDRMEKSKNCKVYCAESSADAYLKHFGWSEAEGITADGDSLHTHAEHGTMATGAALMLQQLLEGYCSTHG